MRGHLDGFLVGYAPAALERTLGRQRIMSPARRKASTPKGSLPAQVVQILGNRELAAGVLAVAFVVALVGTFSPWWGMSFTGEMFGQDIDAADTAGPFDDGGFAEKGGVVLSGILMLVGMLGLLAAAVLIGFGLAANRDDTLVRSAPFVAFGGTAFVLLALILAIFMYPGEGSSFWDSDSANGMSASTTAAWGWYLNFGTVLLGIAGGVLALRAPAPSGVASEGAEGSGSV